MCRVSICQTFQEFFDIESISYSKQQQILNEFDSLIIHYSSFNHF